MVEDIIGDKRVEFSRPQNSPRFYMRVGKHGDKRQISRSDAEKLIRMAEAKKKMVLGWNASSPDDFLSRDNLRGGQWIINP